VERAGLELVGGVDIDLAKVGKDVGEVIGLRHPLGFTVADKLAQTDANADVVLHATGSYFALFKDQVIEILEAGLDVVSTAEELSSPGWPIPKRPPRSMLWPGASAKRYWAPASIPVLLWTRCLSA
jgi:4-hydroxy-tetrahydrodipicolinate reductase